MERSNVAFIGYKNSPAHAQQFINWKLHPYYAFATGYIDDIIVFSDNTENYLKYLELILKFFVEINFNIVAKKLFITYPSICLLSYRVDGLGMATITDYIAAIRNI